MSWKEPPPSDADAESMLLPALVSLSGGIAAFCFAPLALVTGFLAWWCWWKCRTDAAVGGFGTTIAALIVNHAAIFMWMLLLGAYVAGEFGVAAAIVVALTYGVGCTTLIGSTAWKYFMSFACIGVVIMSLLWSSLFGAREDARSNNMLNNLRQLGTDAQRTGMQEKSKPEQN